MIYKNLSIKFFRGIKALKIENLSRVNLLLGKNNSGKSSILEAIFLLTGQYNPQLVINIDIFRNLSHNEADDFSFVFYDLDYDNTPEIHSDLFESNSYREIKIKPQNIEIDKDNTTVATTAIDDINIQTGTSLPKNIRGLDIFTTVKHKHDNAHKYKSGISIERGPNREILFSLRRDQKNANDMNGIFQHSNSATSTDLSKRLETIIIQKQENDLVKSLRLLDNKINRVSLGSNGMIYFDIGAKRLIPSNLMGDGIIRTLQIISNLKTVKNGILLIDEIDNGLHFTSLRHIWKIIFETAKNNNVQLFITTHSKDTLIHMRDVLMENEFSNYQKEVRCYTISKNEKGNNFSYTYEFADLNKAIENDIEIRGEF
jgi:AAA15 family ATPase/GTPase